MPLPVKLISRSDGSDGSSKVSVIKGQDVVDGQLMSNLKKIFNHDNFRNDLQRKAVEAVIKGKCEPKILMTQARQILTL